MKKRILIVLGAVLAVGISGAMFLGTHPAAPMPSYQGRTAQEWLGDVLTTNQMSAFSAFHQMGSNMVPVIVRAFEKEDSPWDRFYQRHYSEIPSSLRRRLARPMPDTERWSAAQMAALNVWQAKAAVPDFARLLAAGNEARRLNVICALINFVGPDDSNCVPALVGCLSSTNALVSTLATVGLQRIGPNARSAVPALTVILEGRPGNGGQNASPDLQVNAAIALWKIDDQTNLPSKVLRENLTSGNPQTRGMALIYLSDLQPHDVSLILLMVQMLQQGDVGMQRNAAAAIGKYGAAAKEAVPNLVRLSDSRDSALRYFARASLGKIDPEAAAKIAQRQ